MKLTKKLLLTTPLFMTLPLVAISCKKEPENNIEIKSEIGNNKVNSEVKVENKEEETKPVYKSEAERWEATPFPYTNSVIKESRTPELEKDAKLYHKFQDPDAKTIKYVLKIKNPVNISWKPGFPLYADFELKIGVKNTDNGKREKLSYKNNQIIQAEGKWINEGSGDKYITGDEIIPAKVEFTLNIPQDIEIPEGKEFLYKQINIKKIHDNFGNETDFSAIIVLADKEKAEVREVWIEHS